MCRRYVASPNPSKNNTTYRYVSIYSTYKSSVVLRLQIPYKTMPLQKVSSFFWINFFFEAYSEIKDVLLKNTVVLYAL